MVVSLLLFIVHFILKSIIMSVLRNFPLDLTHMFSISSSKLEKVIGCLSFISSLMSHKKLDIFRDAVDNIHDILTHARLYEKHHQLQYHPHWEDFRFKVISNIHQGRIETYRHCYWCYFSVPCQTINSNQGCENNSHYSSYFDF